MTRANNIIAAFCAALIVLGAGSTVLEVTAGLARVDTGEVVLR